MSCQRNSAQAERSVSRPLSQFECQHLPSLSVLHFRRPSAVGETVPLHAPEQPLLPRSFAPHERSRTASQGKHRLQTGYLYHTTPTNVKVEFTTCETACATEHASLTDMYSTTEKAPAERTCHSKDCHARALSLFRSRSCELKGVNPYPLRVCVCSLAAKPLWHTVHDGSHTFFPQGGLGGRIFGTALLVRCLLEASAENKNSKLCKTSCLQNCHENM